MDRRMTGEGEPSGALPTRTRLPRLGAREQTTPVDPEIAALMAGLPPRTRVPRMGAPSTTETTDASGTAGDIVGEINPDDLFPRREPWLRRAMARVDKSWNILTEGRRAKREEPSRVPLPDDPVERRKYLAQQRYGARMRKEVLSAVLNAGSAFVANYGTKEIISMALQIRSAIGAGLGVAAGSEIGAQLGLTKQEAAIHARTAEMLKANEELAKVADAFTLPNWKKLRELYRAYVVKDLAPEEYPDLLDPSEERAYFERVVLVQDMIATELRSQYKFTTVAERARLRMQHTGQITDFEPTQQAESTRTNWDVRRLVGNVTAVLWKAPEVVKAVPQVAPAVAAALGKLVRSGQFWGSLGKAVVYAGVPIATAHIAPVAMGSALAVVAIGRLIESLNRVRKLYADRDAALAFAESGKVSGARSQELTDISKALGLKPDDLDKLEGELTNDDYVTLANKVAAASKTGMAFGAVLGLGSVAWAEHQAGSHSTNQHDAVQPAASTSRQPVVGMPSPSPTTSGAPLEQSSPAAASPAGSPSSPAIDHQPSANSPHSYGSPGASDASPAVRPSTASSPQGLPSTASSPAAAEPGSSPVTSPSPDHQVTAAPSPATAGSPSPGSSPLPAESPAAGSSPDAQSPGASSPVPATPTPGSSASPGSATTEHLPITTASLKAPTEIKIAQLPADAHPGEIFVKNGVSKIAFDIAGKGEIAEVFDVQTTQEGVKYIDMQHLDADGDGVAEKLPAGHFVRLYLDAKSSNGTILGEHYALQGGQPKLVETVYAVDKDTWTERATASSDWGFVPRKGLIGSIDGQSLPSLQIHQEGSELVADWHGAKIHFTATEQDSTKLNELVNAAGSPEAKAALLEKIRHSELRFDESSLATSEVTIRVDDDAAVAAFARAIAHPDESNLPSSIRQMFSAGNALSAWQHTDPAYLEHAVRDALQNTNEPVRAGTSLETLFASLVQPINQAEFDAPVPPSNFMYVYPGKMVEPEKVVESLKTLLPKEDLSTEIKAGINRVIDNASKIEAIKINHLDEKDFVRVKFAGEDHVRRLVLPKLPPME